MKKILFATSEAVPFIKTGGLADVAGTLPKYFNKEENSARVIYRQLNRRIAEVNKLTDEINKRYKEIDKIIRDRSIILRALDRYKSKKEKQS